MHNSKDLHKVVLSLQKTAHTAEFTDQFLSQAITGGLTHATSTWNCILRAYSKSPTPIKALRVYNYFFINGNSTHPDHYTYPPLLKACSCLLSLSMGSELHAHVIKTGLDGDVYVQNSLLQFYGVVAELRDARVLFDRMPYRDIASWNTFLGVYNRNPDYGTRVLLILFKRLMCEEIKADKITLVILLSACAREEELDCGRTLHSFAAKAGLECTLNLENAILEMYTKCGDTDAALTLFDQIGSRRDIVSYTILINGYVEMGLVDLARKIFDRILIKDAILWGSMMHAYVKANQPKAALELFEKMVEEGVMIPDGNIMVSVISACASLSDLHFGRLVHQFIFRNSIIQDVFVKTALINMYSKCGSLEEALVTFYKMGDRKDVFAWTAMIEGLAKSGHGGEALRLFNQMERRGVTPSAATFVSVLAACTHSGLVTEGCELFRRMARVYRIEPKMEHFGCAIDLLSRAGLLYQAGEFIEIIPYEDKLIAYKTLLSACIRFSEFDLGKKFANEIMKLGSQSHAALVLLSNFYALIGQWDEAAEVRRNMKQFDTRKKPGTSAIEVLRPGDRHRLAITKLIQMPRLHLIGIVQGWGLSFEIIGVDVVPVCHVPEVAEALAIQRGLQLAADLGLSKLYIESDATSVVSLINSSKVPLMEMGHIVTAIKQHLTNYPESQLRFAPRNLNMAARNLNMAVAHTLAKYATAFV